MLFLRSLSISLTAGLTLSLVYPWAVAPAIASTPQSLSQCQALSVPLSAFSSEMNRASRVSETRQVAAQELQPVSQYILKSWKKFVSAKLLAAPRDGDSLKSAADGLATHALNLLERCSPSQADALDRQPFVRLEEAVSRFNRQVRESGARFPKQSLATVFGGVLSQVLDNDHPPSFAHLLQLASHLEGTPSPYRESIVWFYLFLLGVHHVTYLQGTGGEKIDVDLTAGTLDFVLSEMMPAESPLTEGIELALGKAWEFYAAFESVQAIAAGEHLQTMRQAYASAQAKDRRAAVPLMDWRFDNPLWFLEAELAILPMPINELLVNNPWSDDAQRLLGFIRPSSSRDPALSSQPRRNPADPMTPAEILEDLLTSPRHFLTTASA